MTIEVRQLVIKSTVQPEQGAPIDGQHHAIDLSALREELLEECRELVAECVRENVER